MNFKTKIALHSVMQKVSRGIITKEQAADEFKNLTGQELDELIDSDDKETGKFWAFLVLAYPEPQAPQQSDQHQDAPESELSEDPTDAPAVPVDHPKRTRQTAESKEEK